MAEEVKFDRPTRHHVEQTIYKRATV